MIAAISQNRKEEEHIKLPNNRSENKLLKEENKELKKTSSSSSSNTVPQNDVRYWPQRRTLITQKLVVL